MDPEWLGIGYDCELALITNGDGKPKDRHMQYKLVHIVCDRMGFDNDEPLTTTLRFSACVEIHEYGNFTVHPALKLKLYSDDDFGTSSDLWWYQEPFERSEGILRLKEDAKVQENTCVCPNPTAVFIKATPMPLLQTHMIIGQWENSGRLVSFGYVACDEPFDLTSISSTLATSFQVLLKTQQMTGVESLMRLLLAGQLLEIIECYQSVYCRGSLKTCHASITGFCGYHDDMHCPSTTDPYRTRRYQHRYSPEIESMLRKTTLNLLHLYL
jgi:hypothetical protein